MLERCDWAATDPLLGDYHDREWGKPERDSRALWEKLILDGFQAGLSWLIILRKRDAFRKAFEGFDPAKIAAYDDKDVERLLADPGIVRSRSKIEATIGNARAYLAMQARGEDFSEFVWGFVDGKPVKGRYQSWKEIPAKSELSETLSAALKKRGFKFVGPVIVYAWLQAVGVIDDHVAGCKEGGAGLMDEARAVIERLGLAPHPEGGWYRETWRAAAEPGERSAGTAILFLLEAGQRSHWHRVDAAELWLFQAGSALTVSTPTQDTRLGPDLLAGDAPQAIIQPGEWQAARADGGWALVSCVVVPGFEFAGFELAPEGWAPPLEPF